MTLTLLLVAFLLVLDVLVLLGHSHDSRDGQDWKPRGSPSLGPSALRPSDVQTGRARGPPDAHRSPGAWLVDAVVPAHTLALGARLDQP